VLTTDQRGAIAESAIVHEAIKLGVGVLRPLTDGERYDLILDLRPELVRVQCKTAVLRGSILQVPCYSARGCRHGLVKTFYSASEIDAIAAYNLELDRCFFIPLERVAGRTSLQVRLEPCRNNQVVGVNWAEDFAFDARLRQLVGP
jgi:hypothetical protein